MTALGKVLVFIVLLLALVWNALVVNAYVTRANWKAELDRTKLSLVTAADASNAERRRSDESRAAADAVIAQMKDEIARLNTSVKTLGDNLSDAQAKLALAQTTEAATQTRDVVEKANTNKTLSQVNLLQTQLDVSEKAKNDALIAKEKAMNDALDSKIKMESAQRRAEELEGTVIKLNDPLRGKGGVGAVRPQVDKDFKAEVQSVEGDIVVINLGANAKLQKGAVIQISRTKPAPKYVGSLTITSVDPFYASGIFKAPATVAKPTAADMPKIGDKVSVIE
ncbi:hypothetical protein BH11PLA2_BH11PLA2_21420 [soil metagenome]